MLELRTTRNSFCRVEIISRAIKKMDRTSKFPGNDDHRLNEGQRVEDIDLVIMTVSDVTWRLSKDSDQVVHDVITPERWGAYDRSSVHLAGDEG